MTSTLSPLMTRITQADSALFRDAYEIYSTTIPKAEQKTEAQIRAGLLDPRFQFWAFEQAGTVLGVSILYASKPENLLLLEYLAVAPSAQGKGLGSQLFTASFETSRENAETILLMEIDSDAEETSAEERDIRRKRLQFYRRLGCRQVKGFDYILPLENFGPAPRMCLLVLGAVGPQLATGRLRRAIEDVYQNVYQCARTDPRIEIMFSGHGAVVELD